VLIGANPSSNHPRFMAHLTNLRKRGGKIVVVNPVREIGLERFKIPSRPTSLLFGRNSNVANLYLQPHCGGDFALLKAIAAHLWQENKVTPEFIDLYCNSVEEYKQDLETTNVDQLITMSGVDKNEFLELIEYLTSSKRVVFTWAMGLTHQQWGVDTIRSLANLALLLGQIGGPGKGLLPLRGHSNVQGVGTMGVVPKLPPQIIEALALELNLKIPQDPGMDTFASMMAAHRGEIDLALMLGGNLYAANPDLEWAEEALNNIQFTTYVSTTLNLGHFHGRGKQSLILPVRARNEERQKTTQESMFNYVRISEGGFDAPLDNLPTETELFSKIGKELFQDDTVPWNKFESHDEIRKFIARSIPGMRQIENIGANSQQFTIDGRIYHQPKFNTDNGKANLFVGEVVDPQPRDGMFNLTTLRSEGQFNTIVYEEEDIYRGTTHRNVVLMNSIDIDAHKFTVGQEVTVESSCAKMTVEVVEGRIRQGNVAMYYPEGNAIVPCVLDPQSKTPVFKRVEVKIY
ncbi:MAG: molybdopterin dinucleotide binding domain-containing protein, partial [Candidatus Kariarchaeaceae archaeon]